MAELRTLARPYAKAVFAYAEAAGTRDQWSSSLELLSAVANDPTVQRYLASPEHTTEQHAAAIMEICEGSLDEKVRNLVAQLAEKRRLPLLPYIQAQYKDLNAASEKSLEVDLYSAAELDDQQRQTFSQALSSRLDRRVTLNVTVDESLIGGVLIRAGDTVIDGSIRGRLNKLAQALNS